MKNKNIIRYILIILLLAIIIYCIINVINIQKDYKKAVDEYSDLSSAYTSQETEKYTPTPEITPGFSEETVPSEINEDDLSQENNYPNYKKIDFDSLISLNSDIVGWITIPDTIIDYPIVHSKDNNEYLKLTFQKEYSSSGSIFMDMRNSSDFSDLNTIIYGHNMKNGTMFRSLREYNDQEYYENNKYIQIYTLTGSYTYQIISCYQTEKTSTSYKVIFDDEKSYSEWLEEISNNSIYFTNDYDVNKKTITLSTCTGESGGTQRWVVHLQLVD